MIFYFFIFILKDECFKVNIIMKLLGNFVFFFYSHIYLFLVTRLYLPDSRMRIYLLFVVLLLVKILNIDSLKLYFQPKNKKNLLIIRVDFRF